MTLRNKILVLSLLLATPLLAQENDELGVWSEIGIEKAINKNWDVGLELEYRAQNKARFSAGLSTSYKINKYLKFGINYNFLYSEKLDKYKVKDKGEVGSDDWTKGYNFTPGYWYPRHRFSIEATGSIKLWKWLKISLRERYQLTHSKARTVEKYKFREIHQKEYDFGELLVDEDGFPILDDDWNPIFVDKDGNPMPEEGIVTEQVYDGSKWVTDYISSSNEQVLRSRLKFEYDKKRCPYSPFVSVEFHNIIDDQRSTLPLQKIRTAVGSTYKFRKHNELSLSYMITFDKEDSNSSNSTSHFDRLHTICLGYKYSF
jgi:hypothetical protein